MSQIDMSKKVPCLKNYKQIKVRIQFHACYAFWLGIWYQGLRYCIPILSASLAAIVGTNQLASETIVIWVSVFITFLGTLNSVIHPEDSYSRTAFFASQFAKFQENFELEFNKLRDEEESKIIEFLIAQNQDLTDLIDRFNKPLKRQISEHPPLAGQKI